MISRKDMLVDSQEQQAPVIDEKKLVLQLEEGAAFLNLIESRGWKMLHEKFIAPRLNLNRFLQTTNEQQRHETWGALKELSDLMDYINRRVKDGEQAAELLNTKRGG